VWRGARPYTVVMAGQEPLSGSASETFDRFASWASRLVARAGFFAFCVALIVGWAPTIFVFDDVDTWQLVINTPTTIITFLLVALLQNTQRRDENAGQDKLSALADAVADLADHHAAVSGDGALSTTAARLRLAVVRGDQESSG
jgi:low affinity Fe/Cu permease